MPKPFHELRERLLCADVAPRHVRRYLSELAEHLHDLRVEEEQLGHSPQQAEASALLRLGSIDQLAKAMIDRSGSHAWSAQAPWAVFSLCPLIALAGTYLLSLLVLWSGWRLFLPAAGTPFGAHPTHGFQNLYFQAGKALYYGAPVLVGWGVGVIAGRQRLKALWPAAGLALIACVGALARVQASRTAIPHGLGHIRMDLAFEPSTQGALDALVHFLVIFSATALPYLLWRLRSSRLFFTSL